MKKLIFIFCLLLTAQAHTSESVEEMVQKAKDGDPKAHYYMGMAYSAGFHLDQDLEKAVHHYQEASKQGHSLSTLNLANHYFLGQGVERSLETAFKLFSRAAEDNVPEAKKALASMYYRGLGVSKDADKALDIYESLAEEGFADAMVSIADILHKETPDKSDEIVSRINDAVQLKHPAAVYKMGLLFYYGQHVEQNIPLAYAWIDIAATMSYPDANSALKILNSQMTSQARTYAKELSIELREMHFADIFVES